MDINKILNSEFKNLSPYQPGKPIEELAREKNLTDIIKLASNENPLGASPLAIKAIRDNLEKISYYPDANNYDLKQALSKKYNVNTSKIIIGNGSDEIQLLLAKAFLNDNSEVIIPKYSFANYKIISNAQKAKILEANLNNKFYTDIDNILKNISKNTKIIFLANPGNPISTYIESNEILKLLDNIDKNILVLLDEAYYEYRLEFDGFDTSMLLDLYPNLIITRTFSKGYGLAGIRVGYGFANDDIINLLHQIKLPFNVNKLASVAAVAALSDFEHLQNTLELNKKEKINMQNIFKNKNIEFINSYTNFLTIKVANSLTIYENLLNKGIIVRPLNNYGLNDYLRITIGNESQNKRFIESFFV